MVQELRISLLSQHPKNPRKVYTDIDELAASIKEKGVLQNLTVIPDDAREGHYLVVIGNRRLAAARKAGIESLPCTISDMSEEEAVQIMLTENMQRKDLTPIEEAYGIQMCIEDYGIKVEDLSQKTGLSKTTLYHRLNIAKLDRDILKEADGQITMKEFEELEKLKSIENRNEAARLLGKPGFSQKVNALATQEGIDNWKEDCKKILNRFATKVDKQDFKSHEYVTTYYYRYDKDSDIPEEPKDEGEYFYIVNYSSIYLYKFREDEGDEEDEDEDREEAEIEERENRRQEIFEKYYHRRLDFVKSRDWEMSENDVVYHLLRAALNTPRGCWMNKDVWKEIRGEEFSEKRDILGPSPSVNQINIIYFLYCRLEDGDSLDLLTWRGEYQDSHPKADALYSLLDDMGYIIDETEGEILDGTWELYEGNESDEEDDE